MIFVLLLSWVVAVVICAFSLFCAAERLHVVAVIAGLLGLGQWLACLAIAAIR